MARSTTVRAACSLLVICVANGVLAQKPLQEYLPADKLSSSVLKKPIMLHLNGRPCSGVEHQQGGLVHTCLEDSIRLDVEEIRRWFTLEQVNSLEHSWVRLISPAAGEVPMVAVERMTVVELAEDSLQVNIDFGIFDGASSARSDQELFWIPRADVHAFWR